MTWRTEQAAIGNFQQLQTATLDVSGNVKVSAFVDPLVYPTVNRMVIAGADGSLGVQIASIYSSNNYSFYGDGSIGDYTYDTSTTLTREMFFNNLTITNNAEIKTAGFIIRVLGTLTIAAGSIISCDGGAGGDGSTGVQNAYGGVAPYSNTSGAFPFMGVPGNGGDGAVYVTTAGTNNSAGATGGGVFATGHTTMPVILRAGSGGGGGGAHGGTGLQAATQGVSTFSTTGTGGTGGTATGAGSARANGGGGGAGGGVLIIYANIINNAGTIRANGGNGGAGGVNGANQGAGGGGGGGGAVIIFYRDIIGSGTGSVRADEGSAGSGGTGVGTGIPGTVLLYKM